MLDVFKIHALGRALHEDLATIFHKRERREQDHNSYTHTHAGVSVEAVLGSREPDDQSGDDDTDVVECVADHVDEDSHHAEIATGRLQVHDGVAVLRMSADGL